MTNEKQKNSIIRAELNIEKWPLFATSTYKGKSKEIIRTIKLPNGDIDTRKVIIGKINNVEVGVFRIFDFKGFCALLKIWEEQGRPVNKNALFSVHRIAEILNLSWGGKTYSEIKAMLMRLRKIPIDWVNSFYNRESKENEQLIESFNILADLKIYEKGKRTGQMAFAFSSFSFDKRLVTNLLNNYSKPLILDNILRFKKETSILLYRYIDLIMADKTHFERNTKELLIDLDLSQEGYPYPAQRRKLFAPVLKELLGVHISTGLITKADMVKCKSGADWKVVFEKEKMDFINIKNTPLVVEKKKESKLDNTILQQLIDRGITKDIAKQLAKSYSETLIKEKIEVFDLLKLGNSRLISQNPPGWLRRAIENNYTAPSNLETIEQKQQKEVKTVETRERVTKANKIESYQKWIDSSVDSKIWWDLAKWKKNFASEHGRSANKEEIDAKKQELVNQLPSNEEMQVKIFGKIVYDEDGNLLKGTE